MPHALWILLWTAWIIQAATCAVQAARLERHLKRRVRSAFRDFRPHAIIVVPFKGVDGVPRAIEALCRQEYPGYELVCVVESRSDPVHGLLERELSLFPDVPSRILVAGPSGPREGQKVHNQLRAIETLESMDDDEAVWVFADSDATPDPQWLDHLVGPLARDTKTACCSGYRWLIPTGEGDRPASIWSHAASICNSAVACQLGRYALNRAWGGSMAIKARIARRGSLRTRLVGALSDDYQVTRMCRDLGMRIAFEPRCLVASPARFDRASLFAFARRQYLITRVAEPRLYATALCSMGLYVAGTVSAVIALVVAAISGPPYASVLWPATALLLVHALDRIRAATRRRIVEVRFGPDGARGLSTTLRLDRWLTPVWMTLHLMFVLSAAFGSTFTWQGMRYRMGSLDRTECLDRESRVTDSTSAPRETDRCTRAR